jgi:hypothetical protein
MSRVRCRRCAPALPPLPVAHAQSRVSARALTSPSRSAPSPHSVPRARALPRTLARMHAWPRVRQIVKIRFGCVATTPVRGIAVYSAAAGGIPHFAPQSDPRPPATYRPHAQRRSADLDRIASCLHSQWPYSDYQWPYSDSQHRPHGHKRTVLIASARCTVQPSRCHRRCMHGCAMPCMWPRVR